MRSQCVRGRPRGRRLADEVRITQGQRQVFVRRARGVPAAWPAPPQLAQNGMSARSAASVAPSAAVHDVARPPGDERRISSRSRNLSSSVSMRAEMPTP
jgi:hypothetical protein